MSLKIDKKTLEGLYRKYNRREFVHPDPLEFLYNYEDDRDREVVGLIASTLAYGRVRQILKSVSSVLDRMGTSPYKYLMNSKEIELNKTFCDFKHRFTVGCDMSSLLAGIKGALKHYGSLNKCFIAGLKNEDATIIPALGNFVRVLSKEAGTELKLLTPPEKKSACKRLNLYLRWMVRKDDVDPGSWHGVPASKLVVPLDTHMHQIGLALGLTKRKQANLTTALEISSAFAKISPEDPIRYDFALTRFGIWRGAVIPAEAGILRPFRHL